MKKETIIIDGITVNNIVYENEDFRTDSEKEAIINICSTCEKFHNESCLECGCLIESLIGLKHKKCPINKW